VEGDAPAERRSVLPCGGARVCGVAGALRADLVIRSLPGAAQGLGPARRGGWPVADRGRRTGVAGLGGRSGGAPPPGVYAWPPALRLGGAGSLGWDESRA